METMKVNERDYEVVKLLGKGKGGYSYLVRNEEKSYVLKQIHHEPCEYYQFGNKLESELNDYQKLLAIGILMPTLIEVDQKRERLLKTFFDGETIFELVLKDQMKSSYLQQVHKMCKVLYEAKLNIDYFPTNFVVQEGLLYYIDYECNSYMEEWNFENWGVHYWSKTKIFLDYIAIHG